MKVRAPAVAGQFYPADPGHLRNMVNGFIKEAVASDAPPPKAIIAPHAGYRYSGPIAGTAYSHLAQANDKLERIILIGPSHWARVRALAASSAEAFATPLGTVPIDQAAQKSIEPMPQVEVYDEAHRREHGLEVHLPFLQTLFEKCRIVPLVVGAARPDEVGQVLDRLWGGSETAIVISSDLSHYQPYETAASLDGETAKAIERLQPLAESQACGRAAINGLLQIARKKKLTAETVDLRSSGDTAGSRERVVGYGAFVFREPIY